MLIEGRSGATAIGALREAARDNLSNGDPHGAVRFLSRALEERPGDELYPDVVAELGEAEAVVGLPRASERLDHAISMVDEPCRRGELALVRGRLLLSHKRYADAASAFEIGLRELSDDDPELGAQLHGLRLRRRPHPCALKGGESPPSRDARASRRRAGRPSACCDRAFGRPGQPSRWAPR